MLKVVYTSATEVLAFFVSNNVTHFLFPFLLLLSADKTVWATGCNGNGQLGLGHTNQQNTPVQVTAVGNDVVGVLCGSSHTIFAKADKTVWATGCNATGQLGLGHTNQQNIPVLVRAIAGYSDVVLLSSGGLHQCTHYLRRRQ